MPSGPRMPNCAAQLVAPLPSNKVRGVLVEAVQSLTEVPGVKYAVWGTLALNIFYFWCAAIDWPAVRHRARPAQGASLPTRGPMYGAQVHDRGADAHGPRPWDPLPHRVRGQLRGQAGYVPAGVQGTCWLGYPDLDPIPDPNPGKGPHPNAPQA